MNLDLSKINDPNVLGELLRELAFCQENGKLGCYSVFEVRAGFVLCEDLSLKETLAQKMGCEAPEVTAYFNSDLDVVVAWFWEGDGTLYFEAERKYEVLNTDCKKQYTWGFCE